MKNKHNNFVKTILSSIWWLIATVCTIIACIFSFKVNNGNNHPKYVTNFTITYNGIENPTSHDLQVVGNDIIVNFIDDRGEEHTINLNEGGGYGFDSIPLHSSALHSLIKRGDEDKVEYYYVFNDFNFVDVIVSGETADRLGWHDWYYQEDSRQTIETSTTIQ